MSWLVRSWCSLLLKSKSHLLKLYLNGMSVHLNMINDVTTGGKNKEAITAREWALCQLTVCFEFQSRSDRTQKLCPRKGVQKESKKVTVKV